jgi:hypothetical protein
VYGQVRSLQQVIASAGTTSTDVLRIEAGDGRQVERPKERSVFYDRCDVSGE